MTASAASAPARVDAFARLRSAGFVGAAIRMRDEDLPRAGSLVGVGEDEMHAIIDVESGGSGFDKLRRPKILFEPHVFWRNLPEALRPRAQSLGIAYPKWKPGNYPSDSYPRFAQALAIDETAACKSASYGLTQMLGENFKACGYDSPQAMVLAMAESEGEQLAATVRLIKSMGLAGKLRSHDWAAVARGWNGPGYAKNAYDDKLAAHFKHWSAIPDTPWNPALDPVPPVVVAPLPPPVAPPVLTKPLPVPAPSPAAAITETITPTPPPAPPPGFFTRIADRFRAAYPRKD